MHLGEQAADPVAQAGGFPGQVIVEADEMDFDRLLEIQLPYLGPVIGTYTDWTITVAGPQGATGSVASVGEATLSSNTTAGTGDRGKVIRCTSTFTLSFTAVATL